MLNRLFGRLLLAALAVLVAYGLVVTANPRAATGPDVPPGAKIARDSISQPEQFRGRRVGNQAWQWRWQVWLPDKWQRIGACETGYGKRPGRWDWNSGTYQGAFGLYHGTWDQFKPVAWWPSEAYLATPWQQYRTALEVHKRYGFSGWGCRGA